MNNKKAIKYFQSKLILTFKNELEKYGPDYDLPYMLFGSFALFMSELIKTKNNNEQIKSATLLIEEMTESKNQDVRDLFMVGFLEVFADEASSVEYSKKYLNKNINDALDIILEYWKRK